MFRRRVRDGEIRAPEARGLETRTRDTQAAGGAAGCEALDSARSDDLGEPVPIATLIARAFGVTGQILVGPTRARDEVPTAANNPVGRRRHLHLVRDQA